MESDFSDFKLRKYIKFATLESDVHEYAYS